MNQHIEWAAILVPISILLILGGLVPFRRYTGLKFGPAFFALAAGVMVGAFYSYHRGRTVQSLLLPYYDREHNSVEIVLGIAGAGLVFPLLAALVLRLWGRWIGENATPAERQPGIEGIRAWFCASNVAVGVLLVACAWLGHDISPVLSAVIVAALLAASPLFHMESRKPAPAPVSAPSGEDLSAEREKIVAMLEAGKLTPEESAELLQALGESARPAPRQVPLTGSQRLLLIGAALVTLGFFLPWFVFNPGKEIGHALQEMQSGLHDTFGNQAPTVPSFVSGQFKTGEISTSGGDIPHGLGWAALALALASALVPYMATTLDAATARTIRHLCLGLGALIVLYLVTQNYRYVGLGLIIAVVGYAIEIAGAVREHRSAP